MWHPASPALMNFFNCSHRVEGLAETCPGVRQYGDVDALRALAGHIGLLGHRQQRLGDCAGSSGDVTADVGDLKSDLFDKTSAQRIVHRRYVQKRFGCEKVSEFPRLL